MDKKNKIHSDDQNNNNININSSLTKAHIIIIHETIINSLNSDFSLLSLKNYINNKYSLKEYEYEIFIGENNINNCPDNTLILFLFNKYKTNSITIKTYKTSFDLHNQTITNSF